MKRAVEKGEQPEHSPIFNKRIDAEDFSQGRDCDRQAEKDERQHSGGSRRELKRIWTNAFVVEIPQEQHQWDQGVDEENDFRVGHD